MTVVDASSIKITGIPRGSNEDSEAVACYFALVNISPGADGNAFPDLHCLPQIFPALAHE
jgi:hypothetical protein